MSMKVLRLECVQAVENMLRLLFLKSEEVHVFRDIDIIHGKVGHRVMRGWGCQL